MVWSALVHEVYERLYDHFGPRHWWPAVATPEPTAAAPFEMIVGAILVQNVSWKNATLALLDLKEADLLHPEGIRATPVEALAPYLRPSGYFRQKAAKLKTFVDHLDQTHGGSLERLLAQPLEVLRPELLGLKGIGPETADCILCYAAGLPIMPMDGYTRRIFHRLGAWPESISYQEMQERFMAVLGPDPALCNEYHAQLDTLGAQRCLKRAPRCGQCPLQSLCEWSVEGASR